MLKILATRKNFADFSADIAVVQTVLKKAPGINPEWIDFDKQFAAEKLCGVRG